MSKRSGSLPRYILVRLLLVVPNVLVLLTLVFFLLRVAPGDPISAALGGQVSPEEQAERRAEAGYDRPLIVQYLEYLAQVARFDFGTTITDRREVTEIIAVNGAATLGLAISALLIALVIAIPLGLLAARYRNTWLDVVIRVFAVVTYAAPVFFVGVLAIILFVGTLGWVSVGGQASPISQLRVDEVTNFFLLDALIAGESDAFFDGLERLILPAATLGLLLTGTFVRLIRVNVAQTLRDDYVEAARSRGLAERRVVFQHAFRNAMVPFVTVLGLYVALTLGGAILTEQTFNWPGIGSQLVSYIHDRDYLAVQGIMTFFAVAIVLISMLIDIINALIDPRVRY